MIIPTIWFIAPAASIAAILTAFLLYKTSNKPTDDTTRNQTKSEPIPKEAFLYIKSTRQIVGIALTIIVILLTALVYLDVQFLVTPLLFISGGISSWIIILLSIKITTAAASNTARACTVSLNKGLQTAFRGSAVMSLTVAGMGLLTLSICFFLLSYIYDANILGLGESIARQLNTTYSPSLTEAVIFQKIKYKAISYSLLSYVMGATVMAFFSRLGYLPNPKDLSKTKDSPFTPDKEENHWAHVSGVSTDFYDSYLGAILAATALGTSVALGTRDTTIGALNPIAMPMIISGGGLLFSIISIFGVRTKENASQQDLLQSLLLGTGVAAIMMVILATTLAYFGLISWGIFGSIITGLVAGIIIGQSTEYYTSTHFTPTKHIAKNSEGGYPGAILSGISVGIISSALPVITIAIAILFAFLFSGGGTNIMLGIYGIAFTAIGILSTLGVLLASTLFASITDQASRSLTLDFGKDAHERADALNTLGHSSSANGRGVAVGATVLTALALICLYLDSIKQWLAEIAGPEGHKMGHYIFVNQNINFGRNLIPIPKLNLYNIVEVLQLNVLNPKLLAGLFLGSCICFVFCALILNTTKDAHHRRTAIQHRDSRLILPALLAIATPIIIGLFFNISGVIGLLIGTLSTGFVLAILLNNAGSAWDNAQKYIEHGIHVEKNKNTVGVGHTIGTLFKDTAGPSLNILIKLMTIVSIVFVGFILKYGLYI